MSVHTATSGKIKNFSSLRRIDAHSIEKPDMVFICERNSGSSTRDELRSPGVASPHVAPGINDRAFTSSRIINKRCLWCKKKGRKTTRDIRSLEKVGRDVTG